QVTVRWESALPIRAALKDPPPESTTGNYVISVSGLPERIPSMRPSDNDDNQQTDDDSDAADQKRLERVLERLKETAILEPKSGSTLHASKVVRQPSSNGSFLFIFDRGEEPITENEKEVTFSTRMGPIEVKAKFNLKDMKYKGGLAV
ncbi:MAG TPA: hypothetical protein VFA04_06965, partial [Bryobacteraceae bacterium]|nr:hypothetical protein [Bryobacteraceae bacterium]